MDLIALLGAIAILLGILGLAAVIHVTVGVIIVLFIIGFVLLFWGGRSRFIR